MAGRDGSWRRVVGVVVVVAVIATVVAVMRRYLE
jgi:hypothetical protein